MRTHRLFLLKPLLVFSGACIVAIFPSLQWRLNSSASVWIKTDERSVIKVQPEPSSTESDDGSFPVTDFTPHVKQLLDLVDLNGGCGSAFNLTVTTPYSVPTVTCPQDENLVSDSWCRVLKKIFEQKRQILPNNVTLSISRADRMDERKHKYRCFENSAHAGKFCMTNFLEMERMSNGIEYPITPWDWENRSSIPIWRGTPWLGKGRTKKNLSKVYDDALARCPRLRAVAWSLDHPNLLDAKIGKLPLKKHPYWEQRKDNGMDRLFPGNSFIPQEEYYTRYQVALVLGGFGAAFRTSIHMSTETAVVLQDYRFKEWFTPMMKPFEHYIPLSEDLSDLGETMHWIANHPREVRDIARNGRRFYERFLSFEKNEEHIAELAYRMALLTSERENSMKRTHLS